MRLLLAALFVFGSVLGVVSLIGANYPDDRWPWWGTHLIITTLFGTAFAALFIFNHTGLRPNISRKSMEEQIADLDEAGLIRRDIYKARRAFEIEAFDDEGPHYYIELDDGRVLYLNGQYLYDYEAIDDDPELNQPRTFPCTEFEMLWHRSAHYAITIYCRGTVLEPELVAPHFTKEDFKAGLIPEDGQILTADYDELKSQRTRSLPLLRNI